MNTKNNQRFQEMELRMETAMQTLMNTLDFKKITVKKICEEAQVNRSTFYAHYIDIYDMLEKMELRLRRELLKSYPDHRAPEEMMFSDDLLVLFLRHVKKHRSFYRAALQTRRNFPLIQGYEGMWNQVIKPRCEQAGVTSESEMMYYFTYFQAGFTMALRRWVETGCGESEEVMAEILKNCIPTLWGESTFAKSIQQSDETCQKNVTVR